MRIFRLKPSNSLMTHRGRPLRPWSDPTNPCPDPTNFEMAEPIAGVSWSDPGSCWSDPGNRQPVRRRVPIANELKSFRS